MFERKETRRTHTQTHKHTNTQTQKNNYFRRWEDELEGVLDLLLDERGGRADRGGTNLQTQGGKR